MKYFVSNASDGEGAGYILDTLAYGTRFYMYGSRFHM